MAKHTQTIVLSVFDHFVGLALKGLITDVLWGAVQRVKVGFDFSLYLCRAYISTERFLHAVFVSSLNQIFSYSRSKK